MKKIAILILLAGSITFLAACATTPQRHSLKPFTVRPATSNFSDDDDDDEIPKNKVPIAVLAAAKSQVPGFMLEEVDVKQRASGVLYELEGSADGRDYGMIITSDGRILHLERD
jgi:hypothetical protein